jgi:type VI secretion system protein ImpH
MGRFGWEVNSELLLTLCCSDPAEVQRWLPEGQLHRDLLVLLRVYLGWRYTVKLALRLPVHCLPAPVLGRKPLRVNMTAVVAGGNTDNYLTIALGRYQGLAIRFARGASLHVDRML